MEVALRPTDRLCGGQLALLPPVDHGASVRAREGHCPDPHRARFRPPHTRQQIRRYRRPQSRAPSHRKREAFRSRLLRRVTQGERVVGAFRHRIARRDSQRNRRRRVRRRCFRSRFPGGARAFAGYAARQLRGEDRAGEGRAPARRGESDPVGRHFHRDGGHGALSAGIALPRKKRRFQAARQTLTSGRRCAPRAVRCDVPPFPFGGVRHHPAGGRCMQDPPSSHLSEEQTNSCRQRITARSFPRPPLKLSRKPCGTSVGGAMRSRIRASGFTTW